MPHNRLATPHAMSGPQRNTADVQPAAAAHARKEDYLEEENAGTSSPACVSAHRSAVNRWLILGEHG